MFIVACFGLFLGNITSSDWVIIATVYISIQGVSDLVEKLFKAKKSDIPTYNPYSNEDEL